MPKFKIEHIENHLLEIFEVEAETRKEALYKYVNELAGSLQRIDWSYEPEADDSIQVIN